MNLLFFLFFKATVKSPILHNTRGGSEYYVPYLSHYMGEDWALGRVGNEKRFFSSKRVLFFQLTISPSDFLALIFCKIHLYLHILLLKKHSDKR